MADTLEIRLSRDGGRRLSTPTGIDFRRSLSPLVAGLSEAIAIEAGIDTTPDRRRSASDASDASDTVILDLNSVNKEKSGVASYQFSLGADAANAVGLITAALCEQPGSRLLHDTAEKVTDAIQKTIRRGWEVQLVNGVATPVFSDRNPPPGIVPHQTRTYDTEIAVKLLWVGGVKPSARVELHGSRQVVSVKLGSGDAARELGNHLYRDAVLSGRAEWVVDPDQFFRPTRLVKFKVSDYHLLEHVHVDVMFDRLAKATHGVWDDTDPVATEYNEDVAEESP